MQKKYYLLLFLSLFFLLLNINDVNAKEQTQQYLVTLKDDLNYQEFKHTYSSKINNSYPQFHIIEMNLSKQELNTFKKSNEILNIELNEQVSIANINTTAQSEIKPIPWGINEIQALNVHRLGFQGNGIKVAILDSGIEYTHSNLTVRGGINTLDGTMNFGDKYGHGTSVAGIIGATPSNDLIGVAPNVDLYAVKILNDNGYSTIGNIISGLQWSIEHDMDIVNLSVQTTTKNEALKKAIKTAYKEGILLVAAAGNMGSHEKNTITYPGAYDEVLAVGSVDEERNHSFFSSIGKNLDLVAPGEFIYTTSLNNSYQYEIGTSMAAPFVTGTAALVWEANPNFDNKDIMKTLKKSAIPLGDKRLYGKGLVNALNAIQYSNKKAY